MQQGYLADDDDNEKKNVENNLSHSKTDEMRVNNNYKEFFVNTKFHFKNNSWTWANGGQIKANEWLVIPGTNQKYPVIPVQVNEELSSILGCDQHKIEIKGILGRAWKSLENKHCDLNSDQNCFMYRTVITL